MITKRYSVMLYVLMCLIFTLAGCNSSGGGSDGSNNGGEGQQDTDQTDTAGNDDTGDQGNDSTDPGGDDSTDPDTYTVGGTATLLSGDDIRVYLRYQGDPLPYQIILSESGSFRFSNVPIADERTYELELDANNPTSSQCSLLNTNGTIQGADIDDVDLLCIPEIQAYALNQSAFVELNWVNVGEYSTLNTELCETTVPLSGEFDSCSMEGNLVADPTEKLTINPATNNTNYWFELAVRSGDHLITRTVTARPESPAAPTSQDIIKATGGPDSIVILDDIAVSPAGSRVLFNNGTEYGGWTFDFPSNTEVESNYLVSTQGVAYFVIKPNITGIGGTQTHGPRELWRTDGTADGTYRIYTASNSNVQFRNIKASGALVVFAVNASLYIVDEAEEDNYRELTSASVNNLGASFSATNSIPMQAVSDGIIFTGYRDTENEDDTRLLKITQSANVEEVHGVYSYESFVGNLELRNDTLFFSARMEVVDPSETVDATALWQIDNGTLEALFDPNVPTNGGDGFRGVLSPVVTQSGKVYFYTQPWDAGAGEFSSDWRLAYFDGVSTQLIWDETLLGAGWDNSINDSAALQFRRSAAVGESLVFLAPASGTGNSGSGRMWVLYDPQADQFEHLEVEGALRFGRNASADTLTEEKADGTWLVHGYNTYPIIPDEIIHLTEGDTNTFVLNTNGLSIESLVPTAGERLWFRTPNLYRVLAADN